MYLITAGIPNERSNNIDCCCNYETITTACLLTFALGMLAGIFLHGAIVICGSIQLSQQLESTQFEIDGSAALDTITFASPLARHQFTSQNATLEKEWRAPTDNNVALLLDRLRGGRVLFDMVVDPVNQNHITVKFWGDTPILNGTAFATQQNTWFVPALIPSLFPYTVQHTYTARE